MISKYVSTIVTLPEAKKEIHFQSNVIFCHAKLIYGDVTKLEFRRVSSFYSDNFAGGLWQKISSQIYFIFKKNL